MIFQTVSEFCAINGVLQHRAEIETKEMNGLNGKAASAGFISG
jgi:hypothetical protein